MKYKNMKIEINDDQPLSEVLVELNRVGYKVLNKYAIKDIQYKWLVADVDGFILGWRDASILCDSYYKETTLYDLRYMEKLL